MDLQLAAQLRTQSGKGVARKLRQQQRVPAVCYGCHKEPVALSLVCKDLQKLVEDIGSDAKVIPLTIETAGGTEMRHVMLRDLQLDPCKHRIVHVDFLEVDMAQQIVVDVPIVFTGTPAGAALGGVLNQVRHAVSVRCLPADIPDHLELDISGLNIGDTIRVGDLKARIHAEVLDDDQATVVTVGAPASAAAGAGEEQTSTQGEEVTAEGK